MTEQSQAARGNTIGDTAEMTVLEDAARGLRECAERLPADSAWREVCTGVAEGFEAGATINQMRQEEARRAA